MKIQKIKRYRMPVSTRFPKTHPRAGQSTYFKEQINGSFPYETPDSRRKIHTIRENYPLWEKRMKEVQEGRAVIELFYWEHKPYRSKQIVFATLDKNSGCGVQKIIFKDNFVCAAIETSYAANLVVPASIISVNDGLSLEDFKDWFKSYDLSEPMAIIHFTKFRY